MKYVVEKGLTMPLCCIDNDIFFDYLSGQVITNENTLNFIKNGIKNKTMEIKVIDLIIYQIVTSTKNIADRCLIGYNYQINGISNYLDINRQPIENSKRQHIIDKLMSGQYKQEIIWSGVSG